MQAHKRMVARGWRRRRGAIAAAGTAHAHCSRPSAHAPGSSCTNRQMWHRAAPRRTALLPTGWRYCTLAREGPQCIHPSYTASCVPCLCHAVPHACMYVCMRRGGAELASNYGGQQHSRRSFLASSLLPASSPAAAAASSLRMLARRALQQCRAEQTPRRPQAQNIAGVPDMPCLPSEKERTPCTGRQSWLQEPAPCG